MGIPGFIYKGRECPPLEKRSHSTSTVMGFVPVDELVLVPKELVLESRGLRDRCAQTVFLDV